MSHSDILTKRIYVNLYADDWKENYEKYNTLDVLLSNSKKNQITIISKISRTNSYLFFTWEGNKQSYVYSWTITLKAILLLNLVC